MLSLQSQFVGKSLKFLIFSICLLLFVYDRRLIWINTECDLGHKVFSQKNVLIFSEKKIFYQNWAFL